MLSVSHDVKQAVRDFDRKVIDGMLVASQAVSQRPGYGRGCQQTCAHSGSMNWVVGVSANTVAGWGLRYLSYFVWVEGHKGRR